MVTTEVYDRVLDGVVDERGNRAVNFTNGHGAAMVDDYYLMQEAERQARDALRVADVMSPQAAAFVAASPSRIRDGTLVARTTVTTRRPEQCFRELDWGSAHSHYKSDAIRVPWNTEELEYIRAFVLATKKNTAVVPMLWSHILADPIAVPIFHIRHVESKDRLSTGYKHVQNA